MKSSLPLYAQEKPNTCALACLRMVLAACGTFVEERSLAAQTTMEDRGVLIDDLALLARENGLVADILETNVEGLRDIIADDKFPIAYIDRSVFDLSPVERLRHSIRDAIVHVVIPTSVTPRTITYHDPRLRRRIRKSIRLFERAHLCLGGFCVVCSKPDAGRQCN